MKYLSALAVFFLVLGFNVVSVAGDGAHDGAAEVTHDSDSNSHGKKSGPNKDWSHKRQEQVGQIFPEKTKNVEATAKPSGVKLTSPQFLSKISGSSVKLEWAEATNATNYHVQISKDAGFNNRSMYLAEDKWVDGTSFDVANLEPGVKYFWRVAAVNKKNDSQYTKSVFTSSAFETAAQ